MSGLRDNFDVNVSTGRAPGIIDQATAAGMGALRRGWESGRIGNELNPLYTEELDAGIAGDAAKQAELRAQIEHLKQRQSMYAPEVGRVEDVHGIGDGLGWLGGQVGQGAASMADPMAVSAGLGTVGRVAGMLPGAYGKVIGGAAQLGALAVPALMSKRQLTGEFVGEAEQDQELMARTSPTALRDMAGDYGTLAAIPDSFLPGMVGRQISGLSRAGSQVARQGLMGAGAKTALGMGSEGLTEAGQDMGSKYAQGLLNPDRDTSGDASSYLNSGLGGMVGAGPFAGAGALAEAGHNRIDGGVDAVKNKAGEVIDTFNDDPRVQAGKDAIGKMAGKAKGDVIDTLKDADGEISVGGVVGKASDHIQKWTRSAEDFAALQPGNAPEGVDAAWFAKSDQKRAEAVSRLLGGMADDPEAQAHAAAVAAAGADPEAKINAEEDAAEFLIGRHEITQKTDMAANRVRRLASTAGNAAGVAAKGIFGLAKDVAGGVMQGISKKNFQTDESGQQGGNVDDPYLQWQERVGFPSAKGESDTAKGAIPERMGPVAPWSNPYGANSGPSNALREASRRRAEIFGDKMAAAAKKIQGRDPSIQSFMRETGYEIAELSEKWGLGGGGKPDAVKHAPGLILALSEIADTTRINMGDLALATIDSMKRMSDPRSAPMFDQLASLISSGNTPEGRKARAELRTTAADNLLQLVSKEHYREYTSGKIDPDTQQEITPDTLLRQVEELARGGYPKQVRDAMEAHYGRGTFHEMMRIVNDLSIEGKPAPETTGPVDALAEKEGLDAMDKTRGNDIYGFRGNLGDRSRADHKDVFAASSKLDGKALEDTSEEGDQFNRPQLFRTTTDDKGEVTGTQLWGKGTRSEGKTMLSTKIAEMKAKLDSTDEDTNGWDVQARSAHDILNDQGASPQKRLQLYRTYLRQDTRTNEGSSAEDRAHADKTRPEFRAVNELISEIVARQGRASKPESEWTNEDTAAWQKQLTRATKNGFKGEDTSPAALDRFEVERLMPQVDAYFKSHHMVVARNQQDNNEQKLGVDKVLKMKEKGKKLADRVGYDATLAKVDGGQAAHDQVVSDANIIMFPTQARDKDGNRVFKKDKSGKDVPVPGDDIPIRASDLVLWAKSTNASNGQTQDVQEEKDSPAKLNRKYLEHLLAGISAFVGEGHAIGMPYKMNGGGEQESFADSNIPQSLRLDNAVYAEALSQPGFRLTNKSGLGAEAQKEEWEAEQDINYGADKDARRGRLYQGEVIRDQGRNSEFFTVEDREDRELVVDERDGVGERKYAMSQRERDVMSKLKTPEKRAAYVDLLKRQHGEEWAAAFDADGPQGAQYASSQNDGLVTRQGRSDGWESTGRMNEEARGTSTRMRVDVSGKVAADPKGDGAPLDYTRGQDEKAEWDENSDLAYRTSVLNADFKAPTNAMKAMTSAKYNAEALTGMFLNDPREGDRMAITMLRSALKSSVYKENKGKAFDPYRVAPLIHLVTNNKETEGKDKFAALTNAEYFQQAGATPELISILRRGSMQVLIREAKAMFSKEGKGSAMTEAHLVKLARQLPGVGTNVTSYNVLPKLQAALVAAGGGVSENDLATNWGDPALRKVQPKMSAPPVAAKPGAARQAVKTADAERMAAQAGKPPGKQAWELDEDEMGAGLDAMVETAEMKAQRINATVKAWGASDAANDALRKRTDPEEAARLARNATGGRPSLEQHRAKDKLKADRANKFIGRGSEASSTNKYMKEWGDKANTGVYSKSDVVFISAEGDRAGRITPDTAEIKRATSAGATIITDVQEDRDRKYNVGERRVAYILVDAGYVESAPGTWTPGNAKPAPGVANAGLPKAQATPSGAALNVWYGTGENAALSNLAARPFELGGVRFHSVEHAYQSSKSGQWDQATYDKYTGAGRKVVGTKGTKVEGGWNLTHMKNLVLESFKQNPEAAKALLATGNRPITHTQDRGVWAKEFPRIMTEVRSELVPAGTKRNAMAVSIHNDLGRSGFGATHDSPSPHEGKFDWRAHTGKGEGGAAFGAGTYLSTSEGTHKHYKGMFTAQTRNEKGREVQVTLNGEEFTVLFDEDGSPDFGWQELSHAQQSVIELMIAGDVDVKTAVQSAITNKMVFMNKMAENALEAETTPEVAALIGDLKVVPDTLMTGAPTLDLKRWNELVLRNKRDVADLEQLKMPDIKIYHPLSSVSPTFQVSVDIKPEQLLDWNVPLSEQSELVQKALYVAPKSEPREFNDGVLYVKTDEGWTETGWSVTERKPIDNEVANRLRRKLGKPPLTSASSSFVADFGDGAGGHPFASRAEAEAAVLTDHTKHERAWAAKKTGGEIYKDLVAALGSQFAASEHLQSLGILGNTHNANWGKQDEYRNYVIYDDSKITTNYVHFNKQGKPQGAHEGWKNGPTARAATQAEMDSAKSWLDKVLPGTVLKFVDEAGWSGEYVEAQNLINISKTAAAGIMGTVYHEGLHKFFGQLIRGNPKLLAKMNGFVNDPKVMARLIELLDGYPAAQDQLVDGEERLAYAFQFWKAGLLQVDVTPQGFFQSVGALFRRILGHMRDSEHALAIFSAFDKGELANPSTAGTIIAKQLSKGTGALKTRRQLDKFVQGLAAGVLPTEMILGNSVSSTARKLGKILFTNPGDEKAGGGQTGYLNAKRASGRSFDNRAKQFIENMSDSDVKAVQEFMQKGTPLDQIKASEHRAAVEGMRNLLDEFHKYMVAGGLKIGKIKDYYPTVWNVDKLIQNKAGFIKMLVNNYAQQMNPEGGDTHKAAERIHASLVDRQGVDQALTATREDGVLSPFFAAQEGRTLSFLSGEHKAEFLEKNMTNTLSQYFHQGARATEYNRRFGEHGVLLERMLKDVRTELTGASKEMMARDEFKDDQARKDWLARQVRDVTMSVGAIEGTLGANISPNMRKFNSWMAVYQNIRLLPMALFSSFVDPLAQVARGAPLASAYETFMTGIKAVYQAWAAAFSDLPPDRVKSEWEKLAEFIGVTEVAAFTHHVAEEYASVYMSPAAKKINDFMFRFNGMEAWDRSNRVMATKWAVRFIEKHAALPDKNHSERWLQELGLKAGTVPLNADGELITSKEELAIVKGLNAGEAARQMQTIHNAIARWVEGAVITPNSAQRPAWSSDPNYSVFFHLKQFSYSFQQTIMKRAVNEVQHGNLAPVGTLAMFIPTMITSDIIKGLIQGGGTLPPYMAGFTAGDWMLHGLQRSGLAGVGDIGMGAASDMSSLGGPAVEQAVDALRDDAGRSIMKAMPAHALFEYMIKGGVSAAEAA